MNKVPMSWKIFDSHESPQGYIYINLCGAKQKFKRRVFRKLKSKASLLIKAYAKKHILLNISTFYPSLNNLKNFPIKFMLSSR
jgi:hypothetical protein